MSPWGLEGPRMEAQDDPRALLALRFQRWNSGRWWKGAVGMGPTLSKATLIGSWEEPRPQKPSPPLQSYPSTESLPESPLQSPGRWALTSPQPTWAEGGCLTTETPVIRNPLPSPHFQWLLSFSSLHISTQPWAPRFHSRCQSSALASWP